MEASLASSNFTSPKVGTKWGDSPRVVSIIFSSVQPTIFHTPDTAPERVVRPEQTGAPINGDPPSRHHGLITWHIDAGYENTSQRLV